ncbi:MAG: thymidine phosphorylase [Planctomycetota bacterium]|nr:thymidine phosphorylase [Planctomycetota bacterium]
MAAVEIISAKRRGQSLGREAWLEFADAAAIGTWSESQLAAMLMAISLVGLDDQETGWLVEAMAQTGSRIPVERFDRPAVDKHSTGGVGDKASLVVAPLAAACGLDVPMISGRSLGHTGGTLDKLESIPGFRTTLSVDEIVASVREAGCTICGASEEIAPADSVLYSLRDLTATVDSIPLICGSILSKKLSEGIRGLVLDVKCGSGAVFSSEPQSRGLARALVASGEAAGLSTMAVLSDMASPLGRTVGNAIEVDEAIDCLRGDGPDDLRELSLQLVGRMLVSGGVCDEVEAGVGRATEALEAGQGMERFEKMILVQGGDPRVLSGSGGVARQGNVFVVRATRGGWVCGLDALGIGRAAAVLGGGAGGASDRHAGVRVLAVVGSEVAEGDGVLELQADDESRLGSAVEGALASITIGDEPAVSRETVLGTIGIESHRRASS